MKETKNSTEPNNDKQTTSESETKSSPDLIVNALTLLAEAFGEPLTTVRVQVYLTSLADLDSAQVAKACNRAVRELKFFPKIAELRQLARDAAPDDDGRPNVELAWAMCPKQEEKSIVWTDEMAEAFGDARMLIQDDMIGARMVFKEQYPILVAKAREMNKPPRWWASLGWDKADRVRALSEAVQKNRLTAQNAMALMADEQRDELLMLLPAPAQKLLAGEKGDPRQAEEFSNTVKALVAKTMPSGKRMEISDAEQAEHARAVREQAAKLRSLAAEKL